MTSRTQLYQLPDCSVDEVLSEAGTVVILGHTTHPSAPCPQCHQTSYQIHSRHRRQVCDLPICDQAVRVILQMRRFFCRNPQCPQRTFVERLPQTVPLRARQTTRLRQALQGLGLALGGEAGACVVRRLHMPVSPDTLLRLVRHSGLPASATPTILGVDDWAWKKRQTYGTILVDLERHRVVDLLPDRSADGLAEWLQKHPGIEIISRDRGGSYAEGASRGAPEALQVADRFHLLTNLREALERLMNREHQHLPKVSLPDRKSQPSAAEQALPGAETASAQDGSSVNPDAMVVAPAAQTPPTILAPALVDAATPQKPLSAAERSKRDRRARRHNRYEEIVKLHAQGVSLRGITRQMGIGRRTIQRYLTRGAFPEISQRRKMPSILDPFEPFLCQRWQAGCHNAVQLYREICERGYGGSRPLVSRWVMLMRKMMPASLPHEEISKAQTEPRATPPLLTRQRQLSPSQAAWLLLCAPGDLAVEHHAALAQMRQASADIAVAYDLAQDFAHMVREHQAQPLTAWLQSAKNCGLTELCSFASRIQRDLAAVIAGLSLPWSQGQVEGQVNRLKLVKRSMFGRAKFDLLRQRVLAPT